MEHFRHALGGGTTSGAVLPPARPALQSLALLQGGPDPLTLMSHVLAPSPTPHHARHTVHRTVHHTLPPRVRVQVSSGGSAGDLGGGGIGAGGSGGSGQSTGGVHAVPVYRTQSRQHFVMSVGLRTKDPAPKWILAGVILVLEIK